MTSARPTDSEPVVDAEPGITQLRAEITHLKAALRTCRTICTAVGMLIERNNSTPDEGFAELVRLSQHTNRKLRDVAHDLITAHQN